MPKENPENNDVRQTCRRLGLQDAEAETIAADMRAGEALMEMSDRDLTLSAAAVQRTQQRIRAELRRRSWVVRLQRIAAVIVMALVATGIWYLNRSSVKPLGPDLPDEIAKSDYSRWDEISFLSFEATRVNIVEQQVDPIVVAEIADMFSDCWDDEDDLNTSSQRRTESLLT